jgi:N-carbamoyl-L-amino-acid hydrolase
VPGVVKMTVELRDLSSARIAAMGKQVEARAREIATRTQTEINMRLAAHHDEALATPAVQSSIEAAAKRVGLETRRLPSGAGHDAQMMSTLGPMGMIFVPSVKGISHAPQEFSRWEDCANGANVLLESVLAWAG